MATTIGYESSHTGSQIDAAVDAVLGTGGIPLTERMESAENGLSALETEVASEGTRLTSLEGTVSGHTEAIGQQDMALGDIDRQINGFHMGIDWEGPGWAMNAATGNVAYNERYIGTRNTTEFIPVSGVEGVTVNSATKQYYIGYYDANKTFISSDGWVSSNSYDIRNNKPDNTVFFRILLDISKSSVEDVALVGQTNGGILDRLATLEQTTIRHEIVVDAAGRGDYTTIEEALAGAGDSPTRHVVIKVMPGTYYPAPKLSNETMPYVEGNRNLTLMGVDKNACILRGDVGYYRYQDNVDYSILRLSGHVTIQGFTILSLSGDYEATKVQQGWTSTENKKAYCIHVDSARQEGDVVEIRDCILINDHFTCIGFGLRPATTLRIVDCCCEMTVGTESGGLDYAPIYGHLGSGDLDKVQKVEIIRCQTVAVGCRYAIRLTQGVTGAIGEAKLIGNVCDRGSFIKPESITLNSLSFGNNLANMNYT